MRLSENFAQSTFFSRYNNITQTDRKTAKSHTDLLPLNFGLRDKASYEKDVTDLENGLPSSEAHGLKENSVLNKISFFHVGNIGMMATCLHHDLFAGCAREDIGTDFEF